MHDTYRHKGLRRKLADSIEEKGIQSKDVIEAIATVPRHLFLDDAFLEFAYQDKAFPIAAGQTISQPYTVAFQTELLEVQKREKVLEIGTGSGYQTAVLCELKAKVFTVERQKELYDFSRRVLNKMNYKAKCFFGDGYEGAPAFAPFGKILVTCGAPEVPEVLLQQLEIGGKMVIPLGSGQTQVMTEVFRTGEDTYEKREYGEFSFVPMLMRRERNG